MVCDHCKTTITLNTNDELEADRLAERIGWQCPLAERIGWQCPLLSFYGGTGHYCKNSSCQFEAKKVEYKS
jgi:hypothetical protein